MAIRAAEANFLARSQAAASQAAVIQGKLLEEARLSREKAKLAANIAFKNMQA